MKKIIIYVLSVAVLAATMQACSDKDLRDANRSIRVSAGFVTGGGPSKAMLESDDLLRLETSVRVYGLASDKSGSPVDIVGHNGESAGTSMLNAGQSLVYTGISNPGWNFYNGGEFYKWDADLNYRFFGWLDVDGSSNVDGRHLNAGDFFGPGFSCEDGVLTIPSKQMGCKVNNFDFAYSDVVTRRTGEADYSDVVLPLHHLFSSFSLGARNYTSKPIYIDAVKIHGLRDEKSATVTFGEEKTSVLYDGGSVMTAENLVTSQIELLPAGEDGDRKTNIAYGASDTRKSFLVWPQTQDELTTNEDLASADPAVITDEPFIEVVYHLSSASASQMVSLLPIPCDTEFSDATLNGWAAGVHRGMELSFSDKNISLTVSTSSWDKQEPVIDYDGAVSVTETLRVADGYGSNCVLSADRKTVYFKSGYPIILEFKVDQPENSTWFVSKKGDFDVFEIDNFTDETTANVGDRKDVTEGLITGDGNSARISILPRISTDELQKPEYKLQLSFSVRLNDGEMTNIDDLIFNDDPAKGPVSPTTFVLLK